LSDPPLLYGPRPRAGPAARLTDREREVLQHIAESKVNKEIADRHLKAEGGPRCAS